MKKTIGLALALFAFGCILGHVFGCTPSKEAKEVAADKVYMAEHLRCVEKFHTDPEIDICRDEVRKRWGIVTVVRDAGGDR